MYNGQHAMTFYDNSLSTPVSKNTWTDWKLIPTERPTFAPPKRKETILNVPGANGSIDLSEALTGFSVYENRQGSFTFIVDPDYSPFNGSWVSAYSEISNFLNGRTLKCVLSDDPDYYYEGMFKLSNWDSKSDGTWSEITIDYNVQPYKYSSTLTTKTLNVSSVTSTLDITSFIDKMPVRPLLTSTVPNGAVIRMSHPLGGDSVIRLTTAVATPTDYHVTLSNQHRSVVVEAESNTSGDTGVLTLQWRNGEL